MTELNLTQSDPRDHPDFRREYYPLADGKEPPPADLSDTNDIRKVEFLNIYYRMNTLCAELIELRQSERNAIGERENEVLQAIEACMADRDALEDKYAPIGFLGEPEMEDVFVTNLKFSYSKYRPHREVHTQRFSMFVAVPFPDEEDVN